MHKTHLLICLLFLSTPLQAALPLEQIELPEGFSIAVYAEDVNNARQMALGDQGTLFVGSRRAGNVYALQDKDGDHYAETLTVIDKGLSVPSGIAFRDGSLYVAALNRVLRYDNIESQLDNPPEPVVVLDSLPDRSSHGWKYIGFGPDDRLYIPVGAPCNICDEPGFAQIRSILPDGSDMQVYAEGIRNTVGITWHPVTDELWFTDNGRDWLGDELPHCELNHAPRQGMHFGFPYCHQGNLLDPEFGAGKNCADYTAPAINLGPHVAPLGLKFYTGEMFPQEYRNQIFIAEHGSWNRSKKIGYRIKMVRLDQDGRAMEQKVFAKGWLQGEESWGRPNDVWVMPDGALLVSDDAADAIYRITYQTPE